MYQDRMVHLLEAPKRLMTRSTSLQLNIFPENRKIFSSPLKKKRPGITEPFLGAKGVARFWGTALSFFHPPPSRARREWSSRASSPGPRDE